MTDLFADIEPDDAWDADATIDALQVAYRLHELRDALDVLIGRPARRWREISRRDQDYLLVVGQAVDDHVAVREPDNPAVLAAAVHNDSNVTGWDDLPPDHQQIAIDLMDLVVDWLEAEGPR